MKKKKYTSGNLNSKSDFHVEFMPATQGGIITDVQSKTKLLHGKKLHSIIKNTLNDLNVKHGKLNVTDNGGQYFVLQARIEAVIKSENPKL
ncbi:uncharacterized protein METZ01_LOCUS330807, partial [marine metagenome]